MDNHDNTLEKAIGARLKALRAARGLTLDELASLSGVSRAMISRIERVDVSPTAALLARLCPVLGLSLSAFFETAGETPSPVSRRSDQPVWRDPQSGYRRRSVSPAGVGSKIDIVEVDFPSGAVVRFADQSASRAMFQHVWLFEGELEMQVGEATYRLAPGDCLYMNIGDVRSFHNPGKLSARYAVVIDTGQR